MGLQQFYQFMSMNKSLKSRHSNSEQRFILVHGTTKEQQIVRWNILTHRYEEPSQAKEQSLFPRMSYQQKKGLLNGLCQRQRASSSFKIRQGFSRKQKQRITSTASHLTAKSQKQNQPFIYVTPKGEHISSFSINDLMQQISLLKKKIDSDNKRLLATLTVKRVGLRYKIFHKFVWVCQCGKNTHNHDLKDISEQLKPQMKQFLRVQKDLYYFFFDRKPIHCYNDIIQNDLQVLIVDDLAKLDLTIGILRRVQDQGGVLQNLMRSMFQKRQAKTAQPPNNTRGEAYDWQRIKNVKEYADKLAEDPIKNKLKDVEQNKNELLGWYSERFNHNQASSLKNTKQSDKNLLFESLNHYPNEAIQKKYLIQAGEKLQSLSYIKNQHQYIPHRIDIMMEQVKRQSTKQGSLKRLKMKSDLGDTITKRDLMRKLDKKNSLLSVQNIPYLIDKYGLNRFQIYNLYNLYKSFEKVSLLRNLKKPEMEGIIQKGIDRQTFQVGLKGLDMNPGEELIKNICYFGDFISWEQFIKIISISLRKTPEEKLTAILKGISSAQNGYLTRYQISLMIGNSLQKLFDREQVELKEYFTNMAMKELDREGRGKVSIQTLKQRVLGNDSQSLNMVSFLILNT